MKFSVIIPVYNVAPYLRECLDSVIAAAREAERRGGQRAASISVEVICVDDGSTDGSGTILDTYASTFNLQPSTFNLRILHQRNAGVSAARNAGLEMASGDYFLFVDSDDVIRDSLLADAAEVLSARPDVSLFGFGLQLFVDGEPEWNPCATRESRDIDLRDEIPDLMAMLSAYRFVYRLSAFGDLRFPAYSRGEDLVYVAYVLARADKCVYSDREEYGYRNRPGSAVHGTTRPEDLGTAIAFHREMFAVLEKSGKRLGMVSWRMRLEQWVLRMPLMIMGQGWNSAWESVWQEWIGSMSSAVRLPYLKGWDLAVARLACCCPCRPVMALACRLGVRLSRRKRKKRQAHPSVLI